MVLVPCQARGEELQDGQHLPASEDPDHMQRFVETRLRARGIVLRFIAGGKPLAPLQGAVRTCARVCVCGGGRACAHEMLGRRCWL